MIIDKGSAIEHTDPKRMTEPTNCSAYVIANSNPNPNTETEPELEPELEFGRRRFGHEPRTAVRVRCMPSRRHTFFS